MNGKLTICSVSYSNKSTGLLDLMVDSIIKNTDFTPNFVICDSGKNDLAKYSSLPNFTIINNPNISSGGSLQHGEGLNAAFLCVKTKYTAIVESDCIVLSKDWYKIEKPYKVLASKKGSGLYHACFLVFETEILRGIDFRPGTNGTRSNRSYKASEDVGWSISSFVKEEQIDFVEFVDCKTNKAKIFKSFQSDEFHKNGKVIAAHFGRGGNLSGKAVRKGFRSHPEQLESWKNIARRLIKEEEK